MKKSDRDNGGRFAPGNAGGPGNPFARQVGRLRATLLNAVTEADLQEIAAALVDRAKGGDLAAAKLLFGYCIGRPSDTVDPDALDVDEARKAAKRIRAEDDRKHAERYADISL